MSGAPAVHRCFGMRIFMADQGVNDKCKKCDRYRRASERVGGILRPALGWREDEVHCDNWIPIQRLDAEASQEITTT